MEKTEEMIEEGRIDELGRLAMYETKVVGIIHGRHQRSYSDRIDELQQAAQLTRKEKGDEVRTN